jgi:hypothetical protein
MKEMTSRRTALPVLLTLCVLSPPVYCQNANGGRSAFDFLKISPISRAIGLGGAYTAIGDDIGSIFYNPAGLASLLTTELNFTYLSLYQGMNYEFIALGYPIGESLPSIGGTVALGVNLLQPGNLQRTNDAGVTVGTFTSGDQAFTLAYARAFGPSVHGGLSVKLIQQQVDTIQTSLFDVDAGVVVLPAFDGMRIGATLRHLGAQSANFDLPMSLNAAISYRKYELFGEKDDGALTVETTFPIRPIEDRVGMRVGGEYNFKWVGSRATVRAGYMFLDKDLNGVGLAVGAGYGLDLSGAVLFFDYAYAPADLFGEAHRLSLTTKF